VKNLEIFLCWKKLVVVILALFLDIKDLLFLGLNYFFEFVFLDHHKLEVIFLALKLGL
jgi:hypothetical protein